jgi:hypothetical protein
MRTVSDPRIVPAALPWAEAVADDRRHRDQRQDVDDGAGGGGDPGGGRHVFSSTTLDYCVDGESSSG